MNRGKWLVWLGLAFVAMAPAPTRAASDRAARTQPGVCAGAQRGDVVVDTELAGVPAILRIPAKVSMPPIVVWHGFGPPASEQAMMQAFPLDDVPATKVYLGLPMFGKRAPAGGTDELVRRQREDVGLLVFEPVVVGAANELPRVVAALEQQRCLRTGDKIGLLGFSAGGASVLQALAQHVVPVGAAVLLNPSTGLTASVQAFEHATGLAYAWTDESRALAQRTDAAEHVVDIVAGNPSPAILVIRGDKDDVIPKANIDSLKNALESRYALTHQSERFRYDAVGELPHNLESSGPDDALHHGVAAWFKAYLRRLPSN